MVSHPGLLSVPGPGPIRAVTRSSSRRLRPVTLTWRDRLVLASPLLGISILATITPGGDPRTFCPFALLTGTACPGCGMTRAASALVRGDLAGAFALHPLVLAIGIELMLAWGWFVLRRAGRVGPISDRALNLILAVTALSLVAVWMVRLTAGTLPPV